MKVVFFGASELGYKCCNELLQQGIDVVGIVTIPKKFDISYSKQPVNNVLHADFHVLAKKHGIPIVEINQNLNKHIDEILAFNGDLFVVVGWYYLIKGKLLQAPAKGVVGIHGSLLPKYRGNAPLVWAVINGERETGMSLFYFTEGVDEGDIIDQIAFEILPDDYISDVLKKAEKASLELIRKNIPLIAAGKSSRIPQKHEDATYFPARSPKDGEINWDWDTPTIKNFIRAQSKPYPGAFTHFNGKKVIIWDAEIIDENDL